MVIKIRIYYKNSKDKILHFEWSGVGIDLTMCLSESKSRW